MPAGPKGRRTTTFIRSFGIWKFSKNVEPVQEFVEFFYIIPIMFAKAVQGTSTKEAVAWAEEEIKRIYST